MSTQQSDETTHTQTAHQSPVITIRGQRMMYRPKTEHSETASQGQAQGPQSQAINQMPQEKQGQGQGGQLDQGQQTGDEIQPQQQQEVNQPSQGSKGQTAESESSQVDQSQSSQIQQQSPPQPRSRRGRGRTRRGRRGGRRGRGQRAPSQTQQAQPQAQQQAQQQGAQGSTQSELREEKEVEARDEAQARPQTKAQEEQPTEQDHDHYDGYECCEPPGRHFEEGHGSGPSEKEQVDTKEMESRTGEELGKWFSHDGLKFTLKKGCVPNMKVEGLCYANKGVVQVLLDEYNQHSQMRRGGLIPSLIQIANVAALPGIVGHSMAMPDVHCGYGFAIGGVAAMDTADPEAVVSPGGVGFDINCGVRLLKTNLNVDEFMKFQDAIMDAMFERIGVGVGTRGNFKVSPQELDNLLNNGVKVLLEKKVVWPEDVEDCEENGCLRGADASKVSQRAKTRGGPQLGTLGSGNHYVEVQTVEDIYDEKAAKAMGLFKGQICIMIHTGSRGLGHQVCTDFLQIMSGTMSSQGVRVNDRQLAACKINSNEGKNYLAAMAASANFAFCNRSIIASYVREAFSEVFGKSARDLGMFLLYDVCHNTAKFEQHIVNGEKKQLLVHRKGATRSFPPNHPDIPRAYRSTGQPVLIGGSMGTHSYVLTGTDQAMKETWGSTCHGAGRQASRAQAKREISVKSVFDDLQKKGVAIRVGQRNLVAEEAVGAYKDVDDVVQTCHDAGLSKKCVRLRPVGVLKG